MSESHNEYIPRAGEFDPLADEMAGAVQPEITNPTTGSDAHAKPGRAGGDLVLRVLSLSEVQNYEPIPGSFLVGESVLELGETSMVFGPPGSFKGFAVGQLMVCGAQGYGTWLGHQVKAQFASLWLNCENGRVRLRDQFRKMKLPPDAERFIHITDIPAVWKLHDPRLVAEIRRTIIEKQIRLLIVDTVSNFVEDEFAKEFAAFFADLNTLFQGVSPKPAVLLIHHSRKPKDTDKGGRGLLNLISGHQMLQRRARSICYLGRVTDDFDEKRVAAVWLKVSNNGKAEGTKTALHLADDATLQPIENFDWQEWTGANSNGSSQREPKVREEHLREVFEDGARWLSQKQAAAELQERAEVGRSAAYDALKVIGGRFSHIMTKRDDGFIGLRASMPDDDGQEI